MRASNLFDGFRALNWDYWKSFGDDPGLCFAVLYLAIVLFLADILWFLLTPKEVRDEWER